MQLHMALHCTWRCIGAARKALLKGARRGTESTMRKAQDA
jgi:hypothetical protein